jgi:hypothetical protein
MSTYTALCRGEVIDASDSLDAVLAFVGGIVDATLAEDVVVWQGGRVAAVLLSTGHVVRFNAPPARPAVPPDLAAVAEVVEDAA